MTVSATAISDSFNHALDMMGTRDKAASLEALVHAEHAVGGKWSPAHLALRAAWCSVDIGHWNAAVDHIAEARALLAEAENRAH